MNCPRLPHFLMTDALATNARTCSPGDAKRRSAERLWQAGTMSRSAICPGAARAMCRVQMIQNDDMAANAGRAAPTSGRMMTAVEVEAEFCNTEEVDSLNGVVSGGPFYIKTTVLRWWPVRYQDPSERSWKTAVFAVVSIRYSGNTTPPSSDQHWQRKARRHNP